MTARVGSRVGTRVLSRVPSADSSGGGGGPEPTCSYPLDASSSEVAAIGLDGKLTMSGGDQTFRYTADGSLATTETYVAGSDGFSSGTAETIDFSTGVKAIEFGGFDMLTPGAATSSPVNLVLNLVTPGLSFLLNTTAGDLGGFAVVETEPASGIPVGAHYLLTVGPAVFLLDSNSSLGLYFNGDTGDYGITLNDVDRYDSTVGFPYDVDIDWSGDLGYIGTFTPGTASILLGLEEGANSNAVGNCGATLRVDDVEFQCSYPIGTVDKCGNAVSNTLDEGEEEYRIYITKTRSTSVMTANIAEIEMMNAFGGADITTTGNAVASSEYSATYAATEAFDNDNSDYWSSEADGSFPDEWIGQVFPSKQNIKQFSMTAPASSSRWERMPEEFELQSRVTGGSWTTVRSFVGEPAWSAGEKRMYLA